MGHPTLRRAFALATAAASAAALIAIAPLAAEADTKPASSSTPTTVSTDSLATAQLANGVGWAQVVIGNTVYVGGAFTGALAPGAASGASPRSNLMSYDLTTGALNSFAPSFNGQVNALAASPDGSTLYVGGQFTAVNGTTRNRLAAINPTTGAVLPWNPNVNGTVNAIEPTASTVYFGGQFTSVGGTGRTRAAAVTAGSAALTTWAPTGLDNAVKSMALNTATGRVALGGFFTTLNGSSGSGFGIVDATTGTTLVNTPIRAVVTDGSTTSAIYGMSTDGTNVYGSGYYSQTDPLRTGNLEGTFSVNWATGATNWVQDCHGDEYDNVVLGSAVYVVGHPHYCYNVPNGFPQDQAPGAMSPTYQRAIAFTTAASGQNVKPNTALQPRYYDFSSQPAPSLLDWFPTLAPGTYTGASQAAYNVITSGNYVLMSGEFPRVNGSTQYGVARFALPGVATNKDGPQLSGSAFPVYGTTLNAGTARISWLANYDRDNENLTYTLYRGNTAIYTTTAASKLWYQRPVLSFTDTGVSAGTSASYRVVATDAYGNSATSATLNHTVGSTSASAYARQIVADGATSYWRLGESSGTAVADTAGGLPATTFGAVTRGAAGAISGDSNTAATFNGAAGTTIATNARTNPSDTFSVSAWFKSTAPTGGQIIGTGDYQTVTTTTSTFNGQTITRTSDSRSHDREISTTADGHVTFTVQPGTASTITSAAGGYNDGKWHQVVGTLSSSGMVLYVDGKQAAANASVTRALGYQMYWRIGGNSGYTAAGQTTPASNYFTGSIDEPAAYVGKALTAAQVANQFAIAGGGAPATNSPPTASFTQSAGGLAVSVDGSASSDSDGSVASYSWSFGDGGTATGRTATHTYGAAGSYSVTLTVTDDKGATGTSTQAISVSTGTTSTTVAKDAFGRTASGSLGTADTGGGYTLTGTASRYSVNGSAAQLSTTAGSTKKAVLGSTSSSDTDITATYGLSALPVGGSEYLDLIGRSVGSDDYRARVGVLVNGGVNIQLSRAGSTSLRSATVSGLTYAVGDRLQVRLQVVGSGTTTVRARVWKVGTAEPTTWQVTTTDTTAALQSAGSVGFGAYLGSAATNGPVTVSVDDLLAVPTGN
jgi:PKD repeat protein